MKIALVQAEAVRGEVAQNIARHEAWLEVPAEAGAALVVFPELSLTGYEPTLARSLATTLDDARLDTFQRIAERRRVVIGVGMPLRQAQGVTISMLIFQPDQPRRHYSKGYLHPDEEPYFVPGAGVSAVQVAGQRVALAICYELSVSGFLLWL